jgi:uncharacterized repeat protein (TIGR01451 family)
VRNLGIVNASDVRTVIQLSSSASDVTAATTAGSCTVQAATITCLQPVLLAGRATEITVGSILTAAGNATLQASVQSYEPDTQDSNNSVQHSVAVAAVADLAVTASAPPTVTEGGSLTYSVVVANMGPNVANDVTANVQLAAGLTVTSTSASQGTCTSSGGLVTCAVGTLAGGSSATITITTAAVSRGTYLATATVTAAAFDPASANNEAQVSVTANAPPAAGGASSASGGAGGAGGGGGGGSTSWPLLALLGFAAGWRRLRER